MHRTPLVALLALALGACGGGSGEEEVQDTAAAARDTVAMAESAFDPVAFDTITWSSDSLLFSRGGLVWTVSCAKCHGGSGRGDGGFVQHGDTLRPPSFLEPDWPLAADPIELRRRIYAGTTEGMPHWGLVGLKHRDIDAVAHYIRRVLRDERGTPATTAG